MDTTETKTGFVAVFRYHQRPARAASYHSRSEFVRDWLNGAFSRENALTPDDLDGRDDFAAAVEAVGHDLHALSIIESEAELAAYVAAEAPDRNRHNPGIAAAIRAGAELGWAAEVDNG